MVQHATARARKRPPDGTATIGGCYSRTCTSPTKKPAHRETSALVLGAPLDREGLLYGNYANPMKELERESQGDFTNYMRMEVLQRLSPRLTKWDSNYRCAHEPGLKLAITLR